MVCGIENDRRQLKRTPHLLYYRLWIIADILQHLCLYHSSCFFLEGLFQQSFRNHNFEECSLLIRAFRDYLILQQNYFFSITSVSYCLCMGILFWRILFFLGFHTIPVPQTIPAYPAALGAQTTSHVNIGMHAAMIANAYQQDHKQMLGQRLFQLIQTLYSDLAVPITEMLLRKDNSELSKMLESKEFLDAKVRR